MVQTSKLTDPQHCANFLRLILRAGQQQLGAPSTKKSAAAAAMASNVIDLALSDDENEQPTQPVVAPQRSTANILQLALARAGGAQFRQPQQARQ